MAACRKCGVGAEDLMRGLCVGCYDSKIDGTLDICAAKKRNRAEYLRAYKLAYPEKQRAYSAKYWKLNSRTINEGRMEPDTRKKTTLRSLAYYYQRMKDSCPCCGLTKMKKSNLCRQCAESRRNVGMVTGKVKDAQH